MLIHLRCLQRVSSTEIGPIISAIADAVDRGTVVTSQFIANLDWVQYKRNFRDPVTVRRFLSFAPDAPRAEIAIDARRIDVLDLTTSLREAMDGLLEPPGDFVGRVYLEEFTPPAHSIMWSFNRSYWEHLSSWEATFKKDYTAALPGGASDGTHPDFWHARLSAFVDVLERMEHRGVLPPEIYVLEFGVGSGQQARVWLDTFRAICAERARGYYGRLVYLMTDYSRDVLQTARRTVTEHDDRVSCLNIDATDPLDALAFLKYKVLFIHSCNLHDNLPTDETMRVGGRAYRPLTRAYVEAGRAATICDDHDLAGDQLVPTIKRVLRFGPDALGDEKSGVLFWADVWDALRLEEVYEEIADLPGVRLAPGVDLRLTDILDDLPDSTRVHLSTAALQSFVHALSLLHPEGTFQVQDIFVRDLSQYEGFRGPGKMDGSIVNWVNGPLFRAVAERLGFHAELEPFTYREGSNTVVLTLRPKD